MYDEHSQGRGEEAWPACPPGTLVHAVKHLKSQQRMLALRRVGGGAIVVALVAITTGLIAQSQTRQNEPNFGGLTCTETRDLLTDFTAGKLDAASAQKVKVHLSKCPKCGPLYRQMMGGETMTALRPTEACTCPRCQPSANHPFLARR